MLSGVLLIGKRMGHSWSTPSAIDTLSNKPHHLRHFKLSLLFICKSFSFRVHIVKLRCRFLLCNVPYFLCLPLGLELGSFDVLFSLDYVCKSLLLDVSVWIMTTFDWKITRMTRKIAIFLTDTKGTPMPLGFGWIIFCHFILCSVRLLRNSWNHFVNLV